jgi:hypothetical protein
LSVDKRIDHAPLRILRSALMRIVLSVGAVTATAMLLVGCGDDGNKNDADSGGQSASEATYDEGTIRMEIELLDTGLLKGHSYVDSADGWTVAGVNITAVADDGTEWGVIEIKEQGDADSVTFFEVQVQELPRGDQITLTTTASFTDDNGFMAERAAVDKWPP